MITNIILFTMLTVSSHESPYVGRIDSISSRGEIKVTISGKQYNISLQSVGVWDNRGLQRLVSLKMKEILPVGSIIEIYYDINRISGNKISATIWYNNTNINQYLVLQGFGINMPIDVFDPDYSLEEETARSESRGVWRYIK